MEYITQEEIEKTKAELTAELNALKEDTRKTFLLITVSLLLLFVAEICSLLIIK